MKKGIWMMLLVALLFAGSALAAVTIKLRGDTAAAWTANNPVLALREPGVETDTKKMKVGDGVTPWTSLEYASGGTVDLTAPGPIGSVTPNTGTFTTVSAAGFDTLAPGTGETGEIGLGEDPANGSNLVTLKAPAALAADLVITLPAGAVPASATANGTPGQWWYDNYYWYVCVAASAWRRAALSTW